MVGVVLSSVGEDTRKVPDSLVTKWTATRSSGSLECCYPEKTFKKKHVQTMPDTNSNHTNVIAALQLVRYQIVASFVTSKIAKVLNTQAYADRLTNLSSRMLPVRLG